MHYNRFNFMSHSVVIIAIFSLCISGFHSFSWHHSFLCCGDNVAMYVDSKNGWCSSIAPVDTPPLHCLTAPVLDTTGTIRCSFWHFAGRGIAEMDACMSMRPVHMCQSVLVVLGVVVHVWNRCRLQSAWYEFFSAYNAQKIILNPVVFDPCWRCRSNSKDQSHRLVYQLDLASS